MKQFIAKVRVYLAAVCFIFLTCLFVLLGLIGGLFLQYMWPEQLPAFGYWIEKQWADKVSRVVCWCMDLQVEVDWQGMHIPVQQRPLVILGVHQSDLLHAVLGQVFLQLAGGPLSIIVKQDLEFMMGVMLHKLRLAMQVNRSDGDSACKEIGDYVRCNSRAAILIYPCGTRPNKNKVLLAREKTKDLAYKNTAHPRPRGTATILYGIKKAGSTLPRVVFVEHRTAFPDHTFGELYTLVGTTVEVRVHDVTNEIAHVLRNSASVEEVAMGISKILDKWYRHTNAWRRHDYTK